MGTYEWIISEELSERRIRFIDRVRAENTEEAKKLVVIKYPEFKDKKLHVSVVSSSFIENNS